MAVHSLISIGSIIATEVRLAVTSHIVGAEFVSDSYVEAGVLRGRAELGEVPLRSVAERDSGEVGGDVVLSVGGAEYIFEVHESAGSDYCWANLE